MRMSSSRHAKMPWTRWLSAPAGFRCILDGAIALIKVVNVISGLALKIGFVAMHTLANKATGLLLFLLPMIIQFESIKVPTIILTCTLATFAATQEGHLIRTE